MAPKRSLSGNNGSSPKKAKLVAGQTSLHSFFHPTKGNMATKAEGNLEKSPSSSQGSGRNFAHKKEEVVTNSARISNQLDKGYLGQEPHPKGKGKGKQEHEWEIIDVDKLDDSDLPREEGSSGILNNPNIPSEISPTKTNSTSPTKYVAGYNNNTPNLDSGLLSTVTFPDLEVDPLLLSNETGPSWMVASYAFLAHTLSTLSKTRSRILILNTITNALRLITLHHPPSLLPALYLMSNTLAPSYIPVELKIGPSVISKAIQQVSGLTSAALSRLYRSFGDPGDVAFAAKSSVRTLIPHPPLTILGVYDTLLKISRAQGQGAGKTKQALVEKLLLSAKGEEIRFLVRTLFQNLRVGAVRTTIITALARAMTFYHPKDALSSEHSYHISDELLARAKVSEAADGKKTSPPDSARQKILGIFSEAEVILKHVFVVHPNFEDIVGGLLDVGLDRLSDRVQLTVGIPIHPTLGSPMRSLEEVYERLGDLPFSAEFKYDGQRAQIHAFKTENKTIVKIFSRHLEDMTEKYPDVVASVELLMSRLCGEENATQGSFILDAEIVAVDSENGELKSFQDLSQRARKDVRLEDIKVSVGIFAYDLMYLNGRPLIQLTFRERRSLFRKHFPTLVPDSITIARFYHVNSCDSEMGVEVIENFWQKAVAGRSEGLMIKVLDHGEVDEGDSPAKKSRRKPLPASYEPDKRTLSWLKLKKDYVHGVADSLDLVPIGAWHGNGRKSNWWSPVLLAVRDAKRGEFVAVCKCMSGFSDTFYKDMRERYAEGSENCSLTPMWNCNVGGYRPAVYFRPFEVWEVRGADITLSPVSIAAQGLVPGERGLSLRFPRFMKMREDKSPEQASSTEFLADLWRNQENRGIGSRKGVDEGELIDVEWESEPVEDELSEEQ
ncbi:hypothetical protein M422DRAFT_27965 [Sphaerobolus stellatus SS14]|nr:hypothetical protein M422DRAFT_27965 [Sphaerobolus stellatus SS14]